MTNYGMTGSSTTELPVLFCGTLTSMEVRYVDAHCHLQFPQYEHDREELITTMDTQGIVGIVVGVDLDSSRKAVALAEKYDHLFASIGLHPNREKDEWYEVEKYRDLAKSQKVIAIGECGLDYFRPTVLDERTTQLQKNILNDQIALAAELDKPLIIHARPSKGSADAYKDLVDILTGWKTKWPTLRGDVHFFVGRADEAQALIALGLTVSYTAVITFAREYHSTIRILPLTSIVSETDAPYVPPLNRSRGSRNDPLAVVEVVKTIAEIRGEDLETVRHTLTENAIRLFALPYTP